MAGFLLVHGAWHGAWCWRRVVPLLEQSGHRVHAVTLTGVGERAHLLNAQISLETHIQDLISALEAEEFDSAILVLHSYAGMLGTAVADRWPDRVKRLVYVDAMVPSPGEAWGDLQPADIRAARQAAIAASPSRVMPAPDAALYGLDGADHAWVTRRVRPHPGGPYGDALEFSVERVWRIPRTFISCTRPALSTIDPIRKRVRDPDFWGGRWIDRSQYIELRTGHDPMVSAPRELADILLGQA